jgi:hypothetical protein
MSIEYVRLRERLLRAGVAPRHVHRYLRELRDHHEDIVQSEIARGLPRAAAELVANARLGTEDGLAQSVLARPELRSIASRFPALTFGLGPAICWLALGIAIVAVIRNAGDRAADALALGTDALLAGTQAVCAFQFRVAPVLFSAAMVVVCLRQRVKFSWPIAGTAALCLLAGTVSIHVIGEQLGVSSALLPFLAPQSDLFGPRSVQLLAEGVARALVMTLVAWSPALAWRHRTGRV